MEVCEFDLNGFYVKIIKSYDLSYHIAKRDSIGRLHVLRTHVFPSNDIYTVQQVKNMLKTYVINNDKYLKERFIFSSLKTEHGKKSRRSSKRRT
jgi:hypothetical protein